MYRRVIYQSSHLAVHSFTEQSGTKRGQRRAILRASLFIIPAIVGLALKTTDTAAAQSITQSFAVHDRNAKARVDHTAWSILLKEFLVEGSDGINRIAYGPFKETKHSSLKSYVKSLERIDPRTLSRPEQFAYWVNLHNAKTVDVVLDKYPVASIRDISISPDLLDLLKQSVGAGGPWKAEILTIAGVALSLDNIEHDILRPIFKDPRIHYVVNCASYGCPNLPSEALTSANLEAQLDAGAKAYINHPRGFQITSGQVTASSIYQWFQADFGGSAEAVLLHASKYAEPSLKNRLRGITTIDSYRYDWSLNDAAPASGNGASSQGVTAR